MPLKNYGVLVGRVVDARREGGQDTPHYQIEVDGGGTRFRVAVNVLSQLAPSELLFLADEKFDHPLLPGLAGLPDGFTAIVRAPGGAALDYIRANLFDRTALRALPATEPGPDNDLADSLDHYVHRALGDPDARIYAFGERWGPENGKPDKVFGFTPGNGVHDIHMNQGNSGPFTTDDGVWQDGGLMLHFPGAQQWVGVFLAFQSQAWHTDDVTGHGTDLVVEPDHILSIVGALINPVGPAPETETVTLLNSRPDAIDLTGWALLDRLKNRMLLPAQSVPAGETIRIVVQPPTQLGNGGGLITVVDAAGAKVDGVSYTRDQASREGWTVAF
ncbi:DUF2278 family protein [Nakamurella sp.]|uniref:DUF2278 family protein n=1 Tax=Nakamurella sp. TaxID=1869182 RepID=UPI0037835DDF